METQVLLAGDFGYVGKETVESLLEDADAVGRMLRKLQLSLSNRSHR